MTTLNADPQPNLASRIYAYIAAQEHTSRAQIAKQLQIAPSTASLHIKALLDAEKIIETGVAASTGGRRATMLRINSAAAYYLVASLGTGHYRYALSDAREKLRHATTKTFDVTAGAESCLTQLAKSFESLINAAATRPRIAGICIALPAPIDYKNGQTVAAAHLPGWNDFPIASWLKKRFNAPVVLENDSNLEALGEHLHHRHAAHTLTVKIGTGIAAGVIINGEIYRGATGAAGEISHLRHPDYGTARCSCGNSGCLETIVSAKALLSRWQKTAAGQGSTNIAELITAAQNSDPTALLLLKDAGAQLGFALCATVALFNPESVFITGALSTVDSFIAELRAALYSGCHPLLTKNLTITNASAGANAALYGAAHLINKLQPVM